MRMNRRTLIAHLLSIALCAFALAASACAQSKIDMAIGAFDAAGTLPAALNLPAAEQTCAAELFRGVAASLQDFKARPSAQAWQHVTSAVADLDAGACLHNPRLVAIVTVAKRIVASIQPAGTASVESPDTGVPDFRHVDDRDLQELKRLTKH